MKGRLSEGSECISSSDKSIIKKWQDDGMNGRTSSQTLWPCKKEFRHTKGAKIKLKESKPSGDEMGETLQMTTVAWGLQQSSLHRRKRPAEIIQSYVGDCVVKWKVVLSDETKTKLSGHQTRWYVWHKTPITKTKWRLWQHDEVGVHLSSSSATFIWNVAK